MVWTSFGIQHSVVVFKLGVAAKGWMLLSNMGWCLALAVMLIESILASTLRRFCIRIILEARSISLIIEVLPLLTRMSKVRFHALLVWFTVNPFSLTFRMMESRYQLISMLRSRCLLVERSWKSLLLYRRIWAVPKGLVWLAMISIWLSLIYSSARPIWGLKFTAIKHGTCVLTACLASCMTGSEWWYSILTCSWPVSSSMMCWHARITWSETIFMERFFMFFILWWGAFYLSYRWNWSTIFKLLGHLIIIHYEFVDLRLDHLVLLVEKTDVIFECIWLC